MQSEVYERFGGIFPSHLHGRIWLVVVSSEISVNVYQTTLCHISQQYFFVVTTMRTSYIYTSDRKT